MYISTYIEIAVRNKEALASPFYRRGIKIQRQHVYGLSHRLELLAA